MKTLMMMAAFQYMNVPYKWGGSNYLGFDCSGYVLQVLHDVGLTLPDMTAHGLYQYCLKNGNRTSMECDSLLFFGSEKKITHVAISIGEWDGEAYMFEAGGAGRNSLDMSKEDLAKRDARVRMKPVSNRSDLVTSIYLPYKKE